MSLASAYRHIPCFADQSAAEALLRSGSLDEVARQGASGPSNPTFGTLSRSGAEPPQPAQTPFCAIPGSAPRTLPACASTRPAGRSPKSGWARGSHHIEQEVAYGSLARAAQETRPRVGQGLRTTDGRAAQKSNRLPNMGRGAVTTTESSVFGPCGPAANSPVGEPNREPSTIDGFSGRVVLCPDGRRVLAWIPASALALLGPILRRNGLIVREEA